MSGRSEPWTPLTFPNITFPNPQNNPESTVNNLSRQLSFLNLGPASQEEVNNLSSELLQLKDTLKEITEDIKDVLSLKNLQSDLTNVKSLIEEEINKIHLSLNQQFLSSQLLTSQLADLANKNNHSPTRHVPEIAYATFSGNPKETKRFVYLIREKLHESGHLFRSEGSKINWIVRLFRNQGGNLGDPCSSYNWWIAILKENARSHGLNSESASAEDPIY